MPDPALWLSVEADNEWLTRSTTVFHFDPCGVTGISSGPGDPPITGDGGSNESEEKSVGLTGRWSEMPCAEMVNATHPMGKKGDHRWTARREPLYRRFVSNTIERSMVETNVRV